jgi:DNA-binding PadR family transcriptional regulator
MSRLPVDVRLLLPLIWIITKSSVGFLVRVEHRLSLPNARWRDPKEADALRHVAHAVLTVRACGSAGHKRGNILRNDATFTTAARLIHKTKMYLATMHSTELLKGTLQTIILKVLQDHGKMYGYELTQRVRDLSDGTILLTEGALYPTLHRMEADGLLKTETMHMGKRIRKYYGLTRQGKSSVQEKVGEFKAFVKTMNAVLNLQTI